MNTHHQLQDSENWRSTNNSPTFPTREKVNPLMCLCMCTQHSAQKHNFTICWITAFLFPWQAVFPLSFSYLSTRNEVTWAWRQDCATLEGWKSVWFYASIEAKHESLQSINWSFFFLRIIYITQIKILEEKSHTKTCLQWKHSPQSDGRFSSSLRAPFFLHLRFSLCPKNENLFNTQTDMTVLFPKFKYICTAVLHI